MTLPPTKKSKCDGINACRGMKLEEIRKILECPVCLMSPKNPETVHFCSNGHMVCGDCRGQIHDCPICRSDDFNGQNPLMKQILLALPKQCPFVDSGCEVEPEDSEMENHTKSCQYRQIECTNILICKKKIPYIYLINHLQIEHQARIVNLSPLQIQNGRFSHKIVVKDITFGKKPTGLWFADIIRLFNKTFVVRCYKDHDVIGINVFLHGPVTEAKKYLCDINVKSSDNATYEINFTGEVISVDVTAVEREENYGTFAFLKSMAKKFLKNDEINFDVRIKPKE